MGGTMQGRAIVFILLLGVFILRPISGWAQQTDEWVPNILRQDSRVEDVEEGARNNSGVKTQYLPDYSYAGYRWGEEPLSGREGTVIKTTEYGLEPDDGKDDTEALRRALDKAHDVQGPVIVRLPPGRILLREVLFLERSNLVLQGQGDEEGGTTLAVTRPLSEMDVPEGYEERLSDRTSQFSWKGGVLWSRIAPERNDSSSRTLATATVGRRGYRVFYLESTANVEEGDVVRIRWFNRDGENSSFLRHVFCTSDLVFGRRLVSPTQEIVTQEVTVTKVRGRRVTVKEPLLHDIRPHWAVDITQPQFLKEVGIADIRIVFPGAEYAGHHNEEGYNGVYLDDIAHGWVQNVTVKNVDTGIIFSRETKNVTAQGVQVKGRYGHHGILVAGYGILVEDFAVHANFLHSLVFGTGARGSVFTDGRVWMAKLDQHRGVNHQNLFDNLSVEYIRPFPYPLFRHGGNKSKWGPTAGAFNTFWNLRVETRNTGGRSVWTIGKDTEAPRGRIIGLHSVNGPRLDIEYGPESYVEGLNRDGISVPSLYEYQHQRRVEGQRRPSISLLRPAHESRTQLDQATTVEAVIRNGSDSVQRVVFYSNGEEIGTDESRRDGWHVSWTPLQGGPHSLHAVLIDEKGRRIRSDPRSCTENDQVVWAGSEEGDLGTNYPNPFSQKSVIPYAIPKMSKVRIELFDTRGRLVQVLVDEKKPAGQHTVSVRGQSLSSGVYFYRITARNYIESGKIVVIK